MAHRYLPLPGFLRLDWQPYGLRAKAQRRKEGSAGFPLTLERDAAHLPKKSWVKISQIRTLSVERLSRKIGRAKPEEVELAITGLNQIVAP